MSNIFDTFGLSIEHQWPRTAFLTSEMLVRAASSSLEDKHVWMFLDFLLPAALNKSFFSFSGQLKSLFCFRISSIKNIQNKIVV